MGLYSVSGAEKFRLSPTAAADSPVNSTGLTTLSTPSAGGAAAAKLWHPSNPMFAFGALAAGTFLLMAMGTGGDAGASFHIGKLRGSAAGSAGLGK